MPVAALAWYFPLSNTGRPPKKHPTRFSGDLMKSRLTSRVLAAAALIGGAVLVTEGGATAAYPGAKGRIAFELRSDIYTVPAGGSATVRLTSDGLSHAPRWSPDGKRIAFNRSGDIWLMNANGTGRRQLTSGSARDREPTWSPDGTRVGFTRESSGGHRDLWSVATAGGSASLLAKVAGSCGASRPSWSPLGGKVVYARGVGPGPSCSSYDIVLLNLSSKTQKVIAPSTGTATYSKPSYPDFGPDGLHVVFQGFSDSYPCSDNAFRMRLDGTGVEQMTFYLGCEGGAEFRLPAAAPSGTDVTGIYSYPAPTFGVRRTSFTTSDSSLTSPDWQPLP